MGEERVSMREICPDTGWILTALVQRDLLPWTHRHTHVHTQSQSSTRSHGHCIWTKIYECSVGFTVMLPHAYMLTLRSSKQNKVLHHTFLGKVNEYSQTPNPLFLLPYSSENPLLLCYSFICWLVLNYCCFRETDVCHWAGRTCGSQFRALRLKAATRETTAHHQNLSLGPHHFTPTPNCTTMVGSSPSFCFLHLCDISSLPTFSISQTYNGQD